MYRKLVHMKGLWAVRRRVVVGKVATYTKHTTKHKHTHKQTHSNSASFPPTASQWGGRSVNGRLASTLSDSLYVFTFGD